MDDIHYGGGLKIMPISNVRTIVNKCWQGKQA